MKDATLEVLDITHINDKTDRLVVRKKEDFQIDSKLTCLPVAAFVTSQARLKLYSYMRQVAVPLYVDTDCLIYVKKKGDKEIPTGRYLGEMTREYIKYRIIEFICAGPKNYGVLLKDFLEQLKAELKVRGFPLTYESSQLLTYERMKESIFKQL
jgi:hypothetical protein